MTNERTYDYNALSQTYKTGLEAGSDGSPERSHGVRKIIVTEFITLDGVIGEPQNWSFPYWDDETAEFKSAELFGGDTILLGRVTYEGFAAAWPDRKGADAFADRINTMEKVVVSTTLKEVTWENSHLLEGDFVAGINELKSRNGGDIYVHGSKTLVKSLMNAGLVDRYNLLVYPLTVGTGLKLFDEGTAAKLKLVEAKAFSKGVVAMVYEPGE